MMTMGGIKVNVVPLKGIHVFSFLYLVYCLNFQSLLYNYDTQYV
jgi:hypothetical protein